MKDEQALERNGILVNVLRRFGVPLVLASALAASAWGQLGTPRNSLGRFRPGDEVEAGGMREGPAVRRPLKVGDEISIPGTNVKAVLTDEGIELPIGVSITVNGAPARTVPPHHSQSVTLFPLTVFSIGGRLLRSDNSLTGGTRSVVGSVFSYGYTENLRQNRRYELGGFYFLPYRSDDGDLYQLSGRYYFNPTVGAQVAYLNTTTGRGNTGAASFTYHLLLDLGLAGFAPSGSRQLSTRLGIGVLNNLSRDYQIATNAYVNRRTLNFSTFVDLSYPLTSRLTLNATEWFVRDRNADINRLALGVSYRF